jgi:CRP-like cAMP-binding protein
LAAATERRVNAGETLIEQWDTSREVFVILEGEFRVLDAGREVTAVGPGEFVGEMAALDWGAGYGAIRIAQVEALTPGTVLVITPTHLRDVLARSPAARDLVERTARERLALTKE